MKLHYSICICLLITTSVLSQDLAPNKIITSDKTNVKDVSALEVQSESVDNSPKKPKIKAAYSGVNIFDGFKAPQGDRFKHLADAASQSPALTRISYNSDTSGASQLGQGINSMLDALTEGIGDMFKAFTFHGTVTKESSVFKNGKVSFGFKMSADFRSSATWDLVSEAAFPLASGIVRAITNKGVSFVLGKDSQEAFNCQTFTPAQVFGEEFGLDIPKKVPQPKPIPAFEKVCPFAGCEYYSGRLRGEQVIFAVNKTSNKPVMILSKDSKIEISKWESGSSRTPLQVPPIPSQCGTPTQNNQNKDGKDKDKDGKDKYLQEALVKLEAPKNGPIPLTFPSSHANPSISVFIEKSSAELHAVDLATLLGDKRADGYYRVKAPGIIDFIVTSYLYFREHKGRWQWTPDNPPKSDGLWMSVGQMVALKGRWKGEVPASDNQATINSLLGIEQGSEAGKKPMTTDDFAFVLGQPTKTTTTELFYTLTIDGATDLYYKYSINQKRWYWTPFKDGTFTTGLFTKTTHGPFWFRVTQEKVVAPESSYHNKSPHEWNVRTIRFLKYLEDLDNRQVNGQNQCRADFKGDGYCDEACNNQANNFDNGDCCAGTCKSTVYPCGSNGYKCIGKSPKSKPCLFMHGLGRLGPYPGGRSSGQPIGVVTGNNIPGSVGYGVMNYWGNMRELLDGVCTEVLYSHADTVNNAWDNPELMKFYHSEAKKIYDRGGVVFAHSMANVILSGACYVLNLCDVKWYIIGGPMRGSKAANNRAAVLPQAVYELMGDPLKAGTRSMTYSYRGMREGPGDTVDAISRTAYEKQLALGILCGTTGIGAGYATGDGLKWAKRIAYGDYRCTKWSNLPSGDFHSTPVCVESEWINADGFVGLDECEMFSYKDGNQRKEWYIAGRKAIRDSNNPQFLSKSNHQDMTFVYGDFDGVLSWARKRVLDHQKI